MSPFRRIAMLHADLIDSLCPVVGGVPDCGSQANTLTQSSAVATLAQLYGD